MYRVLRIAPEIEGTVFAIISISLLIDTVYNKQIKSKVLLIWPRSSFLAQWEPSFPHFPTCTQPPTNHLTLLP